MTDRRVRTLPAGAEPTGNGTHFRVWSPKRKTLEVLIEDRPPFPLEREKNGYFSGLVPGAQPGNRYFFRLDGGDRFPDPVSRFQPDGVHGASQIIDSSQFRWTDAAWPGSSIRERVIYELHVGTFTPEGTWKTAMADLPRLADIGITTVELLPVAAFPGKFGWGYDGVYWFAPFAPYGTPDDFRAFVDRAHALEMGVILDVVYNHLGPEGNYLREFSPHYFSDRATEWGDALNYDGPDSGPVRELVTTNARYWIEEFHLDGLRLDATQQVFDSSKDNILAALARAARSAAGSREIFIVAENEPNDSTLVRPAKRGGYGLDALWNDDFHHSAVVALTGRNEAYYSGFFGNPQEFISAAKYTSLYQGQLYYWQKNRRGKPALDIAPTAAIIFLENHDQVANNPKGRRVRNLAHPGLYRAMTALLCLAPGTPMLFQGQEYGAQTPFHYFADLHEEIAPKVRAGRIEFMQQFPRMATEEGKSQIEDPSARETFEECILDRNEADEQIVALHRDLLALRRSDPAFRQQEQGAVDGAVLSDKVFVLRFMNEENGDRLLLVNLGMDALLHSPPEPLLAPPVPDGWRELWSSENPKYGGDGTPHVETPEGWRIPGHSAVVLAPVTHG